jgi:hypothetical protein
MFKYRVFSVIQLSDEKRWIHGLKIVWSCLAMPGAVHRARQIVDTLYSNDFLIEQLQSNCKLLQNGGMSGADFSFSVQILIFNPRLLFETYLLPSFDNNPGAIVN